MVILLNWELDGEDLEEYENLNLILGMDTLNSREMIEASIFSPRIPKPT